MQQLRGSSDREHLVLMCEQLLKYRMRRVRFWTVMRSTGRRVILVVRDMIHKGLMLRELVLSEDLFDKYTRE